MTYLEIYFDLFPGVCILWAAWMVSWALVIKEGLSPLIHLAVVLLVTAVVAAVFWGVA